MLSKVKKLMQLVKHLRKVDDINNKVEEIHKFLNFDLKSPKVNLGQIQAYLNSQKSFINNLSEVEFQVFSQWGDDGIIQYLITKIDIPYKTFIEFGVENYKESNTRFLLINNSWSGYIIDGSKENIDYVIADPISWACELYTECAFINAENINSLLKRPPFHPEVGILSIDIDGNDYWVWKAIDVINPIIVITEYNSLFGSNMSWTVPYDPDFVRYNQKQMTYYGASLQALNLLAEQKGYYFVGCNSSGNNAYFIRRDKLPASLKAKTVEDGFVRSKFREFYLNELKRRPIGVERIELLNGLPIYDLEEGILSTIEASKIEY